MTHQKTWKILSWNVNGIRAVERKGFLDWLREESPDVLGIQETKADREQLSDALLAPNGYHSFWFSSTVKKGYSGVALYTKIPPIRVVNGLGIERFDQEGRVITAEFEDFTLLNVYFPNGKMSMDRLVYKLEFYNAFLTHVEALRLSGKRIIFCGDVNTAHHEIDLARPKQNQNVSGFLPVERKWLDQVVSKHYLDTLREFRPNEPDLYSWWDLKSQSREKNVGWRIDYFFIHRDLRPHLSNAFLLTDVYGSDHCPVGITLTF
ncbi:exodeoxyribonuclease III [Candidatus Peregrinibacteria bacterium]|nr:MAG: exodeoxyribonuclease III [Candidatus Peregrinibacteria bacterium]